ncbi:MAG: 1-acyl-sn-glycerol-3-phosphate acyltransferase [Defluviitaleaceae bacterium]|nr:1-acyl-sn-glycerol-3-phosphate acyltransferase [Defluviitaleaceae bacterium]
MKIFGVIKTAYWYSFMFVDLMILIAKFKILRQRKNRLSKEEYETIINKRATKWALRQIRNTGSKITLIGEENIPKDIGVLFVSNHQSYFDIGLFLAYFKKNKGFIAKIGVSNIPFIKDYLKDLNCIFIDRGNIRQNIETINKGIEILKSGYSLVIFPEGTRNIEIGSFKAGSFKLATKSKVPIVPVTINGAYKILEKDKFIINKANVIITVHKPIVTENLLKEDMGNLHLKVEEIIRKS